MTLRCPLCDQLVYRMDNILVWALAATALLILTLEALMICAIIRLAAGG